MSADTKANVENGMSVVQVASSVFRVSGATRTKVPSGTSVSASITMINPKSFNVSYTLGSNLDSSYFTVAPPSSFQTNGTSLSFPFTLTAAAEHKTLVFTLTKAIASTNKPYANDTISVVCDSPPNPVQHLATSRDASLSAFVAFTLPTGITDDDLSTATIRYQDLAILTAPTTVTLPVSSSTLTTATTPDILSGVPSSTKRYFAPSVVAGHQYAFEVSLSDTGGQSSTSLTVGAEGISYTLTYNANGGTGSLATVAYGYGSTVTLASASALTCSGYSIAKWNTAADGSGTSYSADATIVMNQGNLTLYAQWVSTTSTDGGTGVVYTFDTGSQAYFVTGYTGSGGAVSIAATVNGYPVTQVAANAFYGITTITSVSFTSPSSVTTIGEFAFYNCTALTTAPLPSGLLSIGIAAFGGCSSLNSVTIPSGITSLEADVFISCSSLSSVTIPSNVTSIGALAFYNCATLTAVAVPSSVTSIGDLAFDLCGLLVTVSCYPITPPALGMLVFGNCSALTTIAVPSASLSTYQADANWSAWAAKLSGTLP